MKGSSRMELCKWESEKRSRTNFNSTKSFNPRDLNRQNMDIEKQRHPPLPSKESIENVVINFSLIFKTPHINCGKVGKMLLVGRTLSRDIAASTCAATPSMRWKVGVCINVFSVEFSHRVRGEQPRVSRVSLIPISIKRTKHD